MEALRTKDKLGRRLRYSGRQSTGAFVKCTPADIEGVFKPLQRHGILPSNYLFEFRKALTNTVNRNEFQRRLKNFYNEENTAHGGPYLDRPTAQAASPYADWQFLSYTLDTAAHRALEAADARHTYASQADKGWYGHQHMTACITASIELAALKCGLAYGDQESILTHARCPETTRKLPRPIELHLGERTLYDMTTGRAKTVRTSIIPDQLFKIVYPDNIKFFVLEADRATEDYETVYEKLRRWAYAITHDRHRLQWGTPSLIILIVTTSEHRMRRYMEKLARITDDTGPFLFKALPAFQGAWKVPSVMYDLVDAPWHRADGSLFDISC